MDSRDVIFIMRSDLHIHGLGSFTRHFCFFSSQTLPGQLPQQMNCLGRNEDILKRPSDPFLWLSNYWDNAPSRDWNVPRNLTLRERRGSGSNASQIGDSSPGKTCHTVLTTCQATLEETLTMGRAVPWSATTDYLVLHTSCPPFKSKPLVKTLKRWFTRPLCSPLNVASLNKLLFSAFHAYFLFNWPIESRCLLGLAGLRLWP